METGQLKKFGQKWVNYGTRWAKAYTLAAVKEAEKLLSKRAFIAIQKYYEKYTPIYYDRTEHMKKTVYKPFHTKTMYYKNKYSLIGGIKLNIPQYHNYKYKEAGISIQSIYFSSIHRGQHGTEVLNTGIEKIYRPILTTPIPYDYIKEYSTSQSFKDKISKRGRLIANKTQKP